MNYLRNNITGRFLIFFSVVMLVFWLIPINIAFGEVQGGSESPTPSGTEQSVTSDTTIETTTETTDQAAAETIAETTTTETITETTQPPSTTSPGTEQSVITETMVDISTTETATEITLSSDAAPPVITLKGDSSVTIKLGSTYVDAGAAAADDVDGDLTSSIIVVNTVDTSAAGSYKVTYDVSDKAGNAATEVTRIVNVVAKPTVTTDKDDYSPGELVIVTGTGWLPDETVELSFYEIPLQLTITYYAIADDNGNIYNNQYLIYEHHLGQTIILTATGQKSGLTAITIFTDSPQIGSVTVGNQSPNTVHPPGSATYTVTIYRGTGSSSFNADLSITTALPSGCTASFSPSTVSFLSGDTSKTSTLTISTTSGTTPAGAVPFTVKAARSDYPGDNATGNGTLTVGGVGSVTVGTQLPNPVYASSSADYIITITRSGLGPFSVNLSILTALPSGCTASFSPSTVSFLSGDTSKTSTLTISTSSSTPAGSRSFILKATNSGNTYDYKISIKTLVVATDTTSPVVTLIVYPPDLTTDNTPTYSGTATDTLTNIVDIEYCVDSDSWVDVDAFTPGRSVNFTFTTPSLSDGLHTIYVKAKDAVGNWSTTVSDALTIGTSPTITGQPLSANKIIGESITFSVTASGTAPLSYQWRKGGIIIPGATGSSYTISSVVLSDAGSYDVIVSNAFGSVTSNSAALTITKAATIISAAPATGTYGETVNLSVTLTSGGAPLSGKTVDFNLNGVSVGTAVTNSSGTAALNGVSLSGIDAGPYQIGIGTSFAGDSNYYSCANSAVLTVNPAQLTINADDKSKIYGSSNPEFTVSYSGFVSGDDLSILGTALAFDCSADQTSPVGIYTVTPGGLSSNNYSIIFVPNILNITHVPIPDSEPAAAPLIIMTSTASPQVIGMLTFKGLNPFIPVSGASALNVVITMLVLSIMRKKSGS